MQKIRKPVNMAILQPEVPHYRTDFFQKLDNNIHKLDIFIFNPLSSTKQSGFKVDFENLIYIANKKIKGVLIYNPFPILWKYDTLVLMLHFAHLTTWLLLLTKFIHRRQIILWGQGISVKRYLQEQQQPDWKLKLQIRLADGVWIYTEKDANQWQKIFPNKPIVALNNTLTGVTEMVEYKPVNSKSELKCKYNITQENILIFCARFENNYRRTDLLIETIKQLNTKKYGFIIIGAGKNKPDFSLYNNVYDFGAIYDTNIKRELFYIADLYFQPGWVGLSIVEAMAYGKPICTFIRSEETKQCVEYSYIENNTNGLIFTNIDDCITRISQLTNDEIKQLGANAKKKVAQLLTPQNMVANALSIL